jgi:predicted MFS family arabinose efflux permease
MAVATGGIVANLYYLQPLLHRVHDDFHVPAAGAAALITAAQVGYALGLALVVPLGDLIPRRRLVVAIFSLAALAMGLGATVRSFPLFAALSLLVGVVSVGGQVMIPFAADLSTEERRGRTVARLMSGLLLGILLSRTVSGFMAEAFGWRGVYLFAAATMAAFAALLGAFLPKEPDRPRVPYRRLVGRSFELLGSLPDLRRRAWLGAMGMAGFSLLWTTLSFKLSDQPFNYSQAAIGLLGLAGAAGVLAANVAGGMADENRQRLVTLIACALLAGSFALLGAAGGSIGIIIAGVVLLDVGVQGLQITNQSIIYALAPEARSSINAAYMVCYFAGGAAGSLLGGLAFTVGGWRAACLLGALFGTLGLAGALFWPSEPSRRAASTR